MKPLIAKRCSAMEDSKQWVEPQIEEISLEADEDALGACWSASQSSRSSGGGCKKSPIPTCAYP